MKFSPQFFTKLLACLFVCSFFSCSKDSDLFNELILQDSTYEYELEEQASSEEDSSDQESVDENLQDNKEDESPTSSETSLLYTTFDELKAFPGAEGFGKYTSGGRHGRIIEVTNLNDNGPGSLRAALEANGSRTVIFKVGGTIHAKSYYDISNGDLTVAGQTAPGGGILIKEGEFRISASNVIIRYLRFRHGDQAIGESNQDGAKVVAYQGKTVENVIFDHCSISWAIDENAGNNGVGTSTVKNITYQNCILSENGYGLLIADGASRVSVYRNLFAHNRERNIRAGFAAPAGEIKFEMINNLVYGYEDGTVVSEGLKFSIIGNKYKKAAGIAPWKDASITTTSGGSGPLSNFHAYIKGNIPAEGQKEYSSSFEPYLEHSPFETSGIVPAPATNIESSILSDVGASKPMHDEVDLRILNNYKNGDGQLINGVHPTGYPDLLDGAPYLDLDKDGMDDKWELANGLDPTNPDDRNGDINMDGYTNLDIFLHSLTL